MVNLKNLDFHTEIWKQNKSKKIFNFFKNKKNHELVKKKI